MPARVDRALAGRGPGVNPLGDEAIRELAGTMPGVLPEVWE